MSEERKDSGCITDKGRDYQVGESQYLSLGTASATWRISGGAQHTCSLLEPFVCKAKVEPLFSKSNLFYLFALGTTSGSTGGPTSDPLL